MATGYYRGGCGASTFGVFTVALVSSMSSACCLAALLGWNRSCEDGVTVFLCFFERKAIVRYFDGAIYVQHIYNSFIVHLCL